MGLVAVHGAQQIVVLSHEKENVSIFITISNRHGSFGLRVYSAKASNYALCLMPVITDNIVMKGSPT